MARPKSLVKSPSATWPMFGSRIPPELTKAIRMLALKSDIKVQDLMIEALKEILIKYGEKVPKV